MKYIIKQKFISLFHQAFDVFDEQENLLYTIRKKQIFFKVHQIKDAQEVVHATIKKRYMRIFSRNDVLDEKGNLSFIIKQRFAIFTKKFKIINKTGSNDTFSLDGDMLAWSFSLNKNGAPVATFKKKLLALTDVFTVDVSDPAYTYLCIAIAVALDNTFRDNRSHSGIRFSR